MVTIIPFNRPRIIKSTRRLIRRINHQHLTLREDVQHRIRLTIPSPTQHPNQRIQDRSLPTMRTRIRTILTTRTPNHLPKLPSQHRCLPRIQPPSPHIRRLRVPRIRRLTSPHIRRLLSQPLHLLWNRLQSHL